MFKCASLSPTYIIILCQTFYKCFPDPAFKNFKSHTDSCHTMYGRAVLMTKLKLHFLKTVFKINTRNILAMNDFYL